LHPYGHKHTQVLYSLVDNLKGEAFADPWDGLLRRFQSCHAQQEALWWRDAYKEGLFVPATPEAQQRYPRDPRRLKDVAAKLRDAGAGVCAAAVCCVLDDSCMPLERLMPEPHHKQQSCPLLTDPTRDTGGAKAHPVLRQAWQQQQRQAAAGDEGDGGAAAGLVEWVQPSTSGSMPVCHLHASLRMTDSLWARLLK
jgi:hypothetical protein